MFIFSVFWTSWELNRDFKSYSDLKSFSLYRWAKLCYLLHSPLTETLLTCYKNLQDQNYVALLGGSDFTLLWNIFSVVEFLVSQSNGTPLNLQSNHIFPYLLWTPSGRCKLYTLQYDSNVCRYVSDEPCYIVLSCVSLVVLGCLSDEPCYIMLSYVSHVILGCLSDEPCYAMLSCAMQWSVGWAVRCEVKVPSFLPSFRRGGP